MVRASPIPVLATPLLQLASLYLGKKTEGDLYMMFVRMKKWKTYPSLGLESDRRKKPKTPILTHGMLQAIVPKPKTTAVQIVAELSCARLTWRDI